MSNKEVLFYIIAFIIIQIIAFTTWYITDCISDRKSKHKHKKSSKPKHFRRYASGRVQTLNINPQSKLDKVVDYTDISI